MTEALPFSPDAIAGWLPLWKGAGFFLATFVLEDVATVGAGLLLATGAISWPVAFVSCFLGIWLGDAGLYALARFGGRHWFERSSFRKFSAKVSRSEKWFSERGIPILIFSRCVPGARLPTYLAAGFLRLPLLRFLFVTGTAAFVWTLLILWLAQTLGAQAVRWVSIYKQGGLILFGICVLVFIALQFVRRAWSEVALRKITTWIERWKHWEFWPMWLFYPPVLAYCLWLALKHRSLSVVTASNPGIETGGLVGESKHITLNELFATSPEFTAEAALIDGNNIAARRQALASITENFGPGVPFILKPDMGQRGLGIKLIRTREQAEAYLQQTAAPLIAQRFVPGPFEVGIFYYRFPHEPHGRIFAITEKIFPVLTGDGHSSISELVWSDPRARFLAEKYLHRLDARRDEVLPAGETLKLVEAGNHAQGCIFRDGMHLNSPQLEARIDEISQKLTGFYIGRYDIRYASEAGLRAGTGFKIIELNGAAAEVASIYDARNSLWSAYRTLFQQWNLVFAIGAENRRRGFAPEKLLAVWKKWRAFGRIAATYPAAD